MYNSFPPEGTLDPQQPWYKAPIGAAHWDRFKAKLTGGRDASGTSYFSMVNVSAAEADKIIANMKKDPRGYPQINQADPEALYNYQTWVVSEYLGSKPKGSELIDDKDVGKTPEGKTTVYKAADKFVDDKKEFSKAQEQKLEDALEETSDKIMDAVDELIAQQKQAFEEFKRQEEEKVKQRIAGYDQYPSAIGPLPMQGPKQAPKKSSSSDDDPWESEVNDQLGTKLDELLEQVKNDPLPQASTKRRKTKGKTPIKRRKLLGESAGLSTTLSEILQNVSDTKQTLFDLYDVEKERFELRKTTDSNLTQLLKSKAREAGLEGTGLSGVDGKGNEEKRKPTIVERAAGSGLIAAAAALIIPMALTALRPLFQQDIKDADKDQEDVPPPDPVTDSPESAPVEQEPVAPVEEPESGIEPQPTTPQNAPPTQLPNTSIPGDYDYNPNAGVPMRAAAKGGKFTKGKHEKLKPIGKGDAKEPTGLKKLKKPLMSAVTLPLKAAAFGPLMLAKTVLSPFASFLPPPAVDFVKKIFDNVAKSAGLSGFDFSITSAGKGLFEKLIELIESIFKPIFDLFKGSKSPNTSGPGPSTPSERTKSSGSTSSGSQSQKAVAGVLKEEFQSQGLSAAGAKLATAEIGRENSLNRNLILGSHDDGGKTAWGAISWQGGREQVLFDELKARGIAATPEGLAGSGDAGIQANAAAMVKEMEARGHTELLNILKKENPTPEEMDRARQLFKDQYFVYNKSIPLQRSRDWYDVVDKMGPEPKASPPPAKPTPEPRPRAQSRSAQISQRLAERNKKPKATKPTVPVGTSTDKQSGV